MPRSQPNETLRRRIETGIAIVAPFLDLALAVGDRVSRLFSSEDPEDFPARIPYAGEHAPRGLRPRPRDAADA